MEMLRYHPSQPTISHFSHPHLLELHNPQIHPQLTSNSPPCGCCRCPISEGSPVYTCSARCNFLLHAWCAGQRGRVTHLAHGSHPLDLHPRPPYPNGVFTCNGCGLPGNDLSFHCSVDGCNFDLHVECARLPEKISHHSHHHELTLLFSPPYHNEGFTCNICRGLGYRQWVYHCQLCNFEAHLGCCATAAAAQPAHLTRSIMHANYSPSASTPALHYNWPSANIPAVHYNWPSASTPAVHYNWPSASTPTVHYMRPPFQGATNATGMVGFTLLAAVLNGVAQEIIKNFLF